MLKQARLGQVRLSGDFLFKVGKTVAVIIGIRLPELDFG